MRKYVLFMLLVLINILYALEFEVKDFSVDDNDLKNAVGALITDMNDDPCAVLRIETDIKNDIFLVGSDIVKREKTGPGEFYFFVSYRTGWIKFACEGYEPYQFQIPQILKPKTTYTIKLTTLGGIKDELIPVVIICDPPDAKIFINKTEIISGVPQSFEANTYSVSIFADSYYQLADTIQVTNENRSFKYTLKPLDPGKIDLVSIPDSVKVFVDNIEKGITPLLLDLKHGSHTLELKKAGYLSIQDSIFINSGQTLEKIYHLQRHAGIVKTNIIPQDAQLFINMESYPNKNTFLISPGIYKIEIHRSGYKTYEQIVNIELDKELNLDIQLIPIKGKLNIAVSPLDTECFLYENKTLINTWKGSRYFQSMLIGKYTLISSALGYDTDSTEIEIQENQSSEISVKLSKQSFNNKLYGKDGNIFDLEKTYPPLTYSFEGKLQHNENKYDKEEYYLIGTSLYLKTIRPLYIGINAYLNRSIYENKPIDSSTNDDESMLKLYSGDDDDDDIDSTNVKISKRSNYYAAQGLAFLPFRFQPFAWYSYTFKNPKYNIEPAFETKAGFKYYNQSFMLLAYYGLKKSNFLDFRDPEISINHRLNYYFEDYSQNLSEIKLLFIKNKINPIYVTYYSHNANYFENEAAYSGNLSLNLKYLNTKFNNLNYENSNIELTNNKFSSNLNLFFTSFLSASTTYDINNFKENYNNELLDNNTEQINTLDTSLKVHLIPAHDFNVFIGSRYLDQQYKTNTSSNLTKFEAIAGLTIRTDSIYENLSINIRANYLIDSKQIEDKYLHGSIYFSAFY